MNTNKTKFQNKYHIESARLKNWDYSTAAAYFVTVCAKNREYSLGEIVDGRLTDTEQARICEECWQDLPNHYSNCALDAFVVMPNHVHGIIFIHNGENNPVETIHELSLRTQRRTMLIPKIIGRFKMRTAKLINKYQKTEGIAFWQRNYYDHVIRDEDELTRLREYIINNPKKWDLDKDNMENIGACLNHLIQTVLQQCKTPTYGWRNKLVG